MIVIILYKNVITVIALMLSFIIYVIFQIYDNFIYLIEFLKEI